MRKIIIAFIIIITIVFILLISLSKDKYSEDVFNNISIKLNNENIIIKTSFNGYFVVENNDEIIVLDRDYEQVYKESINDINNYNKYDRIIFKDNKLLYETTTIEAENIIYKYYDVYTDKLISKIPIGG